VRRPHGLLRIALLGLLTLAGAATGIRAEPAHAGPPVTQTLGSGAWIWFNDPRAVYFAGQHRATYAVWVNGEGNAILGSYDHDTHVISRVVLKYGVGRDDHASPTLLSLPDGRLIAFYSSHGGKRIYYRKTLYPEDIASLGRARRVPTDRGRFGVTYPQPIRLGRERGRIWLFWRGSNWQPTFATSADGNRWSRPRTVIEDGIPGKRHRPYVKVASEGFDTIHFAFTEAHPGRYPTAIYYMKYQEGLFYTASGRTIGSLSTLPITPQQADQVYDPKVRGVRAWVYDVAADDNDQPVIVYDEIYRHNDHRYRYARWTGFGWQDNEIVSSGPAITNTPGWYSAGITLDHEDPRIVYLSRLVNGQYEIEQWRTADGGATWTHKPITTNSSEPNLRPVSPRGLLDNDVVFWMRGAYPNYLKYRTALWMLRTPAGG
jgi:hypothetical protein